MYTVKVTHVKFDKQGKYLCTIQEEIKRVKNVENFMIKCHAEAKKTGLGMVVEVESHVKGLYIDTFFAGYPDNYA